MRRAGRGSILAVVLTFVAGCSDGGTQSLTPRVTEAEKPVAGAAQVLITQAVVDELDLGRLDMADLSDVPAFENPDPRGPCGGITPAAPLSDITARTFIGEAAAVVDIVQPVSDATRDYHDSLKQDLQAGCGPFESTTSQGLTQRVDVIAPVTGLPDHVIAWTARITVGEQRMWVGAISASGTEWYSSVQIQSNDPVEATSLAELAIAVADLVRGP